MRLLVTGGCGFIGSNFINHILNKYPHYFVVNLDRLDYCANPKNVNLSENYKFVHGNIRSTDLVTFLLEEYSIDVVVHFAAQSHVDNSFNTSLLHTKDNVLGTHSMLEASRKYGKLKKFVHVSTDEVYGESLVEDLEGKNEKSLLCPTNPYSASKAAAEMIVRAYIKSYNLPIIITRGNNVYGPRQYPEKLIPKFISLLKEGRKCTVHGSGSSLRAFVHAEDVARAFDLIIHQGEIHRIYNIESPDEFTVLQVLQKLVGILKPNENWEDWVEYVPDRNFNDQRYFVDGSELHKLGWEKEIEFEEGLKSTVEWYLEN